MHRLEQIKYTFHSYTLPQTGTQVQTDKVSLKIRSSKNATHWHSLTVKQISADLLDIWNSDTLAKFTMFCLWLSMNQYLCKQDQSWVNLRQRKDWITSTWMEMYCYMLYKGHWTKMIFFNLFLVKKWNII